MKNSKKGFTLVELLAALVIIGILTTLAAAGAGSFLNTGKKAYYHSLEKMIKSASQDYINDYKSLKPREKGSAIVIDLKKELEGNNYIDPVLDEKGNSCSGIVMVEKKDKNEFDYTVCLKCDGYKTEGAVCDDENLIPHSGEDFEYKVSFPTIPSSINQCDSITLPKGVATKRIIATGEESIIDNAISPYPSSLDSTILGTHTIRWTYRYVTEIASVKVEDKVPPTTPVVKLYYMNGKEYDGKITNENLTMSVNSKDLACPDKYPKLEGSGVKTINYQIVDDDSTKKSLNVDPKKKSYVIDHTLYGDTELYVTDGAGLSSKKTLFKVYVDKNKPSVPTVTYNSGANTCTWKNNYNISLNATDDIGVDHYEYDTNGDGVPEKDVISNGSFIPKNGLDSHNVRFRAVDLAGNKGDWSESHHIHMDTEKPGKATVDLNGYTSGSWTNDDVKQTASATDNVEVASYQYSHDGVNVAGTFPNPWTINWDGQWDFYVRAIDLAGNVGPWSNMYTVKRDTVKPTCSVAVSGSPASSNGFYTVGVNVAFTAFNDNVSGVVSHTLSASSVTASTEATGTTITGTVKDGAGNTGTCTTVVKVDLTTPEITAKSDPLNASGTSTVFTNNLNVTYGPAGGSVSCNPANSTGSGTYTVTCTATGKNGKTASVSFSARHSYQITHTCSGYPGICDFGCYPRNNYLSSGAYLNGNGYVYCVCWYDCHSAKSYDYQTITPCPYGGSPTLASGGKPNGPVESRQITINCSY